MTDCNKAAYEDRADAQAEITVLRELGLKLTSYLCPHCRLWHLTGGGGPLLDLVQVLCAGLERGGRLEPRMPGPDGDQRWGLAGHGILAPSWAVASLIWLGVLRGAALRTMLSPRPPVLRRHGPDGPRRARPLLDGEVAVAIDPQGRARALAVARGRVSDRELCWITSPRSLGAAVQDQDRHLIDVSSIEGGTAVLAIAPGMDLVTMCPGASFCDADIPAPTTTSAPSWWSGDWRDLDISS